MAFQNLVITSLEDLPHYVGRASHVISIIDPEDREFLPAMRIPATNHLVLCCHDVGSREEARARERAMPGSRCIAPTSAMVARALAFASQVSESDTILVHCGHGISRSTAIALAILAQAGPNTPEQDLFQRVRHLRPQACPSPLIVKHADKLLGRNGRLSEAIQAR